MLRVYEANNLQNSVRLSVENMRLNYIIGSSFLIKAEDQNDGDNAEEDREENLPIVSLINP